MLAATSVGQSSKSTGTRSGRYRPNHGKIFVDRLQTAKREKEDLKIKSVDSSTAYNRLTYIVENTRKKSNHKVEIGKSPFCDCEDFTKNSEKELWKNIIWTLRYSIFVDCRKKVICCSSYASVNSPSPPGLTSGISIFCLGWQIPGGGDSWAVKSPGVRTKKLRANALSSVNSATFFSDRTVE